MNRQTLYYTTILFLLSGLLTLRAQPTPSSKIFKLNPKKATDTMALLKLRRRLPKKGMLNKYNKLFKRAHGASHTVFFKRSPGMEAVAQDSVTGLYYRQQSGPLGLAPHQQVIGWHPYWMEDAAAYYPYELLSTVAFFAYDIDAETGAYTDADAMATWRTTPLIDSVHQHQHNVLLTLTSYGTLRNRTLLGNQQAWLTLSDSVRTLLRNRKAQGIDLDVTGLVPVMKDSFVDFVAYLHNKLGDSVKIMLQMPYNTPPDVYDYAELRKYVDTFVLQGFDRDNKLCQSQPAPSAPLRAGTAYCASLESAVNQCLQGGIAPNQLIVSLPLYGVRWRYRNKRWAFVENIPYEDIRGQFAVSGQQFIEALSGSAMVRIGQGLQHDVIWYEGQGSMDQKFQWMQNQHLAGAGLWGLGYDGANPEIWEAVRNNFGTPPWQLIQPLGYDNGTLYRFMTALQHYRKPIGVGILVMIGFFMAGLLLSCLDWRVREAFFHNNSYRAFLLGGFIIALALTVYLLTGAAKGNGEGYAGATLSAFCYGVLIGVLVTYLANSLYLQYRRRLH